MIYVLLTWLLFPLLWLRARLNGEGIPQAIAVIQTAKIGDFVCTTPLFREIKARYPQARLIVVGHAMNEPLARHNPRIDEFVPLPVGGLRGLKGRWWLARTLRERNVDTSICVSPSQAAVLAPFWAGVRRRLAVLPNYGGSSYRLIKPMLNCAVSHQAGRLLLETEWLLLKILDVIPATRDKEAWVSPESASQVDGLLGQHPGPCVGLGVSSGNKLKELGEERLVRIACSLLEQAPISLVLVGGKEDRGLAQQILNRLAAAGWGSRVFDSCGQLDLAALPGLLQRLVVYVGVDSGITYLADAMRVPVVDLMGPADADDQRPTGPQALVLRTALPCAPCSHAFRAPYGCALGTRACVVDADLTLLVNGVLARLPQSIGTREVRS